MRILHHRRQHRVEILIYTFSVAAIFVLFSIFVLLTIVSKLIGASKGGAA